MRVMLDFVKALAGMPRPWRVWVGLMAALNMAAMLFLPRLEAVVVLGAMMLGALIQAAILARKGFVRLLGIGHFAWLPMLAWLLLRLDTFVADPLFYNWVLALAFVNSVSLVIDTIDVARYALGEREPHVSPQPFGFYN